MPKIKGTHNAMKSAMVAAESIFECLQDEKNAEAICKVHCIRSVSYVH